MSSEKRTKNSTNIWDAESAQKCFAHTISTDKLTMREPFCHHIDVCRLLSPKVHPYSSIVSEKLGRFPEENKGCEGNANDRVSEKQRSRNVYEYRPRRWNKHSEKVHENLPKRGENYGANQCHCEVAGANNGKQCVYVW